MDSNTNKKGTISTTRSVSGSSNKNFRADKAFRRWCASNSMSPTEDSWYIYLASNHNPDIKTEIVQDDSIKVEVVNLPTPLVTPETINETSLEHIAATNAKVADINATNEANTIVAALSTPPLSNNNNTTINTTPNNTITVPNTDTNTSSGTNTNVSTTPNIDTNTSTDTGTANTSTNTGKGLGWRLIGSAMSAGIQTIGGAFGALQSATDSDTTKNITAVWDGASTIASGFGPVGQAVGQFMGLMGAAGNISQAITGGTDLISKTDQWMASPLLSWNVGFINDNWGKKSKAFQADLNIIALVGSSYGGSVSDITKAASEADKKFGLFSKKDRQKADEASDAALAKLNAMGKIADSARDQRLSVQSMGEQAGLAYSMLTSGGYNQKYTYAAKKGGIMSMRSIVREKLKSIELEPQVELNWELPTFKDGGSVDFVEELEWIPEFKDGNKLDFDIWFNSIPEEYRAAGYDYKKAYDVFDWDLLSKHAKDPKNNRLSSVSPVADEKGNFPFLKLGILDENKELQGEFDWYNSEEGKEHRNKYDIKFMDGRYYYVPKQLKQGGSVGDSNVPVIEETNQKNVIPEGALHKNKHHMEHAEGLTKKGIPVVDGDGEQQAEIEHSEIIFTLEVTKKLEEYYEIFYSEESTNKEKEQAALDAGKLLVYQILENTEDRTGLIESCKKGGSLTLKKSTDDLIEEVLEWIPTVVIVETDEELKKESKKEELEVSKKDIKDGMKDVIREILVELLVK